MSMIDNNTYNNISIYLYIIYYIILYYIVKYCKYKKYNQLYFVI